MFFRAEDLMKVQGSMLFILKGAVPFQQPAVRYPYIQGSAWDIVGRIDRASDGQIRFCRNNGIIPPWDSFECRRVIGFIKNTRGWPVWPGDAHERYMDAAHYLRVKQNELVGRRVICPVQGWTQFLFINHEMDLYCKYAATLSVSLDVILSNLRIALLGDDRVMRGVEESELKIDQSVPPVKFDQLTTENNLTSKGPYR
ncbi:MAG: hypothetical protein ACOYUZ_06445 [Patescibacteria group bacterium]